MNDPILEVTDLRVSYGRGRHAREVVHGVSFSIGAGRTLGLVGESGSGKSTIGRAIAGLTPVSGGSVRLDGREISTLHGRHRRGLAAQLQMVFQDPYSSMNPALRVADILAEPLRVQGVTGSAAAAKAARVLDLVGLPSTALGRYVGGFSGGQRQRLAIARALIAEPRVVICDEAVSALDLSIQAQVLNLLRDLQRELGVSYLFIGHNLEVVRFISHEFVVLHDGRVEEAAPANEVLRAPQAAYTRRLVSAILSPDPDVQAERRAARLPRA